MGDLIIETAPTTSWTWELGSMLVQLLVAAAAFGVAGYAHKLANRRAKRAEDRESEIARTVLEHEIDKVDRRLAAARDLWAEIVPKERMAGYKLQTPDVLRSIDVWIKLNDKQRLFDLTDVLERIQVFNDAVTALKATEFRTWTPDEHYEQAQFDVKREAEGLFAAITRFKGLESAEESASNP